MVRDLQKHGYDVLNVDRQTSPDSSGPDSAIPFLPADLTDYGQTLEALGAGDWGRTPDAVVHLAAIPSPVHATAGPGLPHQHHQHPHGLLGGRAPRHQARRVGIERDDPWASVRAGVALRTGR